MIEGKVSPQAQDLEQAVLGSCLIDRECLRDIILAIKAEYFYNPNHEIIYLSIVDLYNKSQPVDILTVVNLLRTKGQLEKVGGALYISDLTNHVNSSENSIYYCRVIHQKYISREIIKKATKAIDSSYDDSFDPFDVLKTLNKGLQDIYNTLEGQKSKDFDSMVTEVYRDLVTLSSSPEKLIGYSTGHREMDMITSGRAPGELTILSARASMGKTSFMNAEIIHAALNLKEPIAVFSLETSYKQLIINFLANMMRTNNRDVRSGRVNTSDLASVVDELSKANIYLYDSFNLHIYEFQAKIRMLKEKYGITRAYVDYVQLMKGDKAQGGNREQEVSTISRGLKGVAKDEDISVIALAQISRAVDNRGGDFRPRLSDLRESGALEQDADVIQFIYRPEYYGLFEVDGINMRGKAEVITAKNRNGAIGSTYYDFIKEYGAFNEIPKNNFLNPNYFSQSQEYNSKPKNNDSTPGFF